MQMNIITQIIMLVKKKIVEIKDYKHYMDKC